MKSVALLALLPIAVLSAHAHEDCCSAPAKAAAPAAHASTAATEKSSGHPLRGVVVATLPEKSALLVKHEEIPGVMRAMTMLLKVDESTLASARKDQTITATLVKKADGWWLENVKPAEAPAR